MKKIKSKTRCPQQLSFIKPSKKIFGGALLYRKRKSIRPLSSKDAIHFVLRSQWAMGQDSFLAGRNRKSIERIIQRFAQKFGVTIYQQSINSNHLHLVLRITNRILYRAFIKSISGKIASHVMGQQSFKLFAKTRSLNPETVNKKDIQPSQFELSKHGGDGGQSELSRLNLSSNFWQFRPFSRVVNWGKDFNYCIKYVKQNTLEALGFVPYKPRKNYYTKWLEEIFTSLN